MAYRFGLMLNILLPLLLLSLPWYQAVITCIVLFYLVLLCSLGILANAIYRMRHLMGENLKLVQYDENAMILHVLSLAVLLVIGFLLPADMIIEGKNEY
jgi:hypothetical protein